MKLFRHQSHYRNQLSRRKTQAILYLGLLGISMAVFLPVSTLIGPNGGLLLSFLMLSALVAWMQWRMTKLQQRVFKTEQQLRRLSAQKSTVTIQPQTVSHLEAESFFSRDQTRH